MKRIKSHYDPEFKKMAVELVISSDKSASEIARELGVKSDLVRRWCREFKARENGSFTGNGNLTPEQKELAQLRKELQDIKLERDILKKAVCIFSKSDGKSSGL